MEYNEITIPYPIELKMLTDGGIVYKSPPILAIDINDFDSMAIRLTRQLTRKQIDDLITAAYDATEWVGTPLGIYKETD